VTEERNSIKFHVSIKQQCLLCISLDGKFIRNFHANFEKRKPVGNVYKDNIKMDLKIEFGMDRTDVV
jgi:hypothetical protein